jgi:RnfABCDGE-type electron transport complex B subunit
MMEWIQQIWPAALLAVGLASLFALILLIASIKLRVQVDPKVEQVHKALPGIDCGACGFAGCASYAKAVVANPELIGRCAPGGADVSAAIGQILNLQISSGGAPQRPIVHCRARREDKLFYAEYSGIESCTSANAQPDVQACHFGCLGFGDCVRACKFDALHIVDGLSTVDYHRCTGCGACAKACPRNLIRMVPFTHENMMTVACSSRENGKTTRSFCQVGCIGCGICSKQSELFTVSDNLATLDYAAYTPSEATQRAMDKCPTGVIVYRGKTAPAPRQPKSTASASAT